MSWVVYWASEAVLRDRIISPELLAMPRVTSRRYRFEQFEVDFGTAELRKRGIRLKLSGQPLRILELLVEHPGEVVSREELRRNLWEDDTFVDFERGLNAAVNRLREALGDSAAKPRYIETLPRLGYRFIGQVTRCDLEEQLAPAALGPVSEINGLPADPARSLITGPNPDVRIRISTVFTKPHGFWRFRRWIFAASIVALIAILAAVGTVIYRFRYRPQFTLSSQDTVVIGDFENRTGDPVFDDALRQGLLVGLEQSPYLQIVSDRKANRILAQMGRTPEERLVGPVAVELCRRSGTKALIQESISRLGSAYLVSLTAIRCDTGEAFVHEQVEAGRKEGVLDALDQATRHLRSRLGESLPSIQKYNAPLEQATTASLDALDAYSQALSTWDKKGNRDSLPLFKKAIELDPNFAQAYGALATIYHNLGDSTLARENAAKAYDLRSRVTQAERTAIEARYYSYVTGDLEKVAEVRALEVRDYPESPGAYARLGPAYMNLGRYDEAVAALRKAELLDPSRSTTYVNLAYSLLALNRIDDAATVLSDAGKRNFKTDLLQACNYWVAFLRDDQTEVQRLLHQSLSVHDGQAILLAEQSDTEAYYGRLKKADELSRMAAKLTEQDGDNELAATYLAQAAVRDAEFGNSEAALQLISSAERLSKGQDVLTLAALASARLGNVKLAETQSRELNKQWPLGTHIQRYWLPLIRAEIEMRRRQPIKAIAELQMLTPPLEFTAPSAFLVATLYPTYVRGQAYLASGDGSRAAIEFLKFNDHRSLTINYPLSPLAQLGLARAYSRTGDLDKAGNAYNDSLKLWKYADDDLPSLRQAKSEYAKLQSFRH